MKRRASQSIVFALLTATVVVVCLNAWLTFRAVEDLLQSERWVSRTWHVIDSLEQIRNSLTDAEVAVQEYLLTGRKADLVPYHRAKAGLSQGLATIARLTHDHPEEGNALHSLSAISLSRMSLLDQSIQERHSRHTSSARMEALSEAGRTQMDQMRSSVAQMYATQQRLRAQRVENWRRDARRARITVFLVSAIDLLLLLLTFRYILIERRLLHRSDVTRDHLQRLQSISDVALAQLSASALTEQLLARMKHVISADAILLCLQQDGAFTIAAAAGVAPAPGATIPHGEAETLHRATRTGKAVTENKPAPDAPTGEPFQRNTRSMIAVPLSAAESFTGVLVAGRQVLSAFDHDDEEMLSVTAQRITMALDRANAYEAERRARRDAEKHAEEVRVLNEELEERVRQRTAELETTNRELEAFSYSVSHDLRAPLRTIDGFSLAFEEDYGEAAGANGRDYLRRIREGVQRMGHLIDSLLQLSRITRADLATEHVDLTSAAWEIARELAAQNGERTIDFQIQPGLKCIGDPRLLRAVLENLIGNAVKFTSTKPEARIEVGSSDGAYFVRDNGAGFDMRYADKLFQAFNRLHADNEFRGWGIGLATAARIVRRHHGEIWAHGEVGNGATFWFRLEPVMVGGDSQGSGAIAHNKLSGWWKND